MKIRVRVPGRINLIGDHTDYNEGFVMPAAIDLSLNLEFWPGNSREICVRSANFDETLIFSLESLEPIKVSPGWIDYIKGVCWVLENNGFKLSGGEMIISGKIPPGSGLSSSAALELAVAASMAKANNLDISLKEMALLCQKAENMYVGVFCGIMDQFAVALSKKDHAMLIDCRSLEYRYLPLRLDDYSILIVDSRVDRSLANSAYNRRREECFKAVKIISEIRGSKIKSLRDLNVDDIKNSSEFMPERLYRRARYVVEENRRVLEAEASLLKNDLNSFGYLMNRSHAGLRDLFDVSCPELDVIVDSAINEPGVLGARMTGAGFGGCAVIVLKKDMVNSLINIISAKFKDFGWEKPAYYSTSAAEGLTVDG